MENLFSNLFETEKRQTKPLADRMRPERLSDFVGQENAVGTGSPLRRMIERDVLQSVLFYGPPGTGKTTLAKVIAHVTGEKFEAINAVSSGVPELRKLIAKAQEDRRNDADVPSCLSTRFIASTRRSRMCCFPMWKTAR